MHDTYTSSAGVHIRAPGSPLPVPPDARRITVPVAAPKCPFCHATLDPQPHGLLWHPPTGCPMEDEILHRSRWARITAAHTKAVAPLLGAVPAVASVLSVKPSDRLAPCRTVQAFTQNGEATPSYILRHTVPA